MGRCNKKLERISQYYLRKAMTLKIKLCSKKLGELYV
jgi:hypothetical protein